MTHRENVIAALRGEKPEVIPCLGECPMDVTVFRKLMPPQTSDPIKNGINFACFFDNSAVGIGIGLKEETLSRDANHHIYRYETGSVWRESYRPTFCREATSFPVNFPDEALRYKMPEVTASGRFDREELRRLVTAYHEAGYFVEGSVMGAWYGIYYYLTSFTNILTWMATEPEAAQILFEMTGRFSLQSAEILLGCGVDDIFTASDLGSGSGLLFSPRMFRQYVFPWLKALADLCHQHNAFLHLHSHGHIQDIMDGIVEAGVDIINPVGPSDHNDLTMFKERWGDKITLHGGISTAIARMTEEQIREHVARVITVGRTGGRFFPRTESGIPLMPTEKALFYLKTLKEERRRGYD